MGTLTLTSKQAHGQRFGQRTAFTLNAIVAPNHCSLCFKCVTKHKQLKMSQQSAPDVSATIRMSRRIQRCLPTRTATTLTAVTGRESNTHMFINNNRSIRVKKNIVQILTVLKVYIFKYRILFLDRTCKLYLVHRIGLETDPYPRHEHFPWPWKYSHCESELMTTVIQKFDPKFKTITATMKQLSIFVTKINLLGDWWLRSCSFTCNCQGFGGTCSLRVRNQRVKTTTWLVGLLFRLF